MFAKYFIDDGCNASAQEHLIKQWWYIPCYLRWWHCDVCMELNEEKDDEEEKEDLDYQPEVVPLTVEEFHDSSPT